MARRVLLMCDYLADPLWTAGGGAMLSVDSFPLSSQTKAALRAWADSYNALMDHDYAWPSPAYRDAFEKEGRRLWAVVQDELGPDYDVGYFSEGEGHLWHTE